MRPCFPLSAAGSGCKTWNGRCGARAAARNRASGRLRVTVRLYYEGPPFSGLDVAGRAGRNPCARGSEKVRPSRGSYGPEAKNRHDGAPKGERPSQRAPRRQAGVKAPFGALSPSPSGRGFRGQQRRKNPRRAETNSYGQKT
jgi:hypothetical protein